MIHCTVRAAAHFVIASAIFAAPALAQPISRAEQVRIDQLVATELAASGVPAASIAIVRDGRIVLTKAYGRASPVIPVARPDLPFQIASNSKQFTAMALLLLEDDGKLDLDDPVSRHLPGISGGDRIALRQLLSHTAGLQDYWPQDYSFAAMARPVTPQEILDIWARKPLDFAPGTQWQYSNTGYVVAGLIVEKVAGEPLFAFLRRRIFTPLGMTSVIDLDDSNGAAFPAGYGRYALGPLRVEPPAGRGWLYAAGELSMTATDLAKWNIARINRSLLPADDWAEQETAVRLADGADTGYGLGVNVRERDGRRTISHSGESVGFLSLNTVYPAERAAIVVLTNSWSGNAVRSISTGLARIVLPAAPTAIDPAQRRVRIVFDQLRSGRLDRRLLTANANYYFTPRAIADYRASLTPLGEPTSIAHAGPSSLRGGFVIQSYTITYPTRSLSLSTFAEPGSNGRIEQFLIKPQ